MALILEWEYIPPAEVRGNSRAHRFKRSRTVRTMRDSAYAQARGHAAMDRCSIKLEFWHWRKIDLDNLLIGAKPWVDGLVDANVVADDSPDHVRLEAPEFHKCLKGESKTIMEVRPL